MQDILLQHGGNYIKSDVDGLKLIITYSDEPTRHEVFTLRNRSSYNDMKQELNDIYEEFGCTKTGYDSAIMEMQTVDFHKAYFVDHSRYCYCDIRDRDEIEDYCKEAFDKVWLMRSHTCGNPIIESKRIEAVKRILKSYSDIPDEGYTDWECGYWNGIMGALRWVLGEEKDFLDT